MEGEPKQYTPEEIAQLEKSRTISDAKLLKDGAEYSVNEKGDKAIILTEEQKKALHDSMEFSPKRMEIYSKYIDKKEVEDYLTALDSEKEVDWSSLTDKIRERERSEGVSDRMMADACLCDFCVAKYFLISGEVDVANRMKEKMDINFYGTAGAVL